MDKNKTCLYNVAGFSRLTGNVHILLGCADYPQISGCRRVEYGHLAEIPLSCLACVIKLT